MAEADTPDKPRWDDDDAQGLIGATVLIGLTHRLADGYSQEQLHGVIKSADLTSGIEVELRGERMGASYNLPPDLTNFKLAAPGDYRLRSTGEMVVNPDYIATWVVEPS